MKRVYAGDEPGRQLRLAGYGLGPATRITEVLSQVERWTGFTQHFGHVSTGLPTRDEQAFLATLLAEATHPGLSRMAPVCGARSGTARLRLPTRPRRQEPSRGAPACLTRARPPTPHSRRVRQEHMASPTPPDAAQR